MKIPFEFLIMLSTNTKPFWLFRYLKIGTAHLLLSVLASVTSDSEEEAQEGKWALRMGVGLPLPTLVCHALVEKLGRAIFEVPMAT
jgi:hypothetical protein